MKTDIEVCESNFRKRLDRLLQKELKLPYNAVMRLIREGDVKVNGRRIKDNSFSLSLNDFVEVYHKPIKISRKDNRAIDLSIPLLYEDEDYAIVSKPSGLPTQGGSKVGVSLLNHFFYKFKTPFLVHRLDKDTSGIVVVAKHLKAAQEFTNIMKNREILKTYLTLLKGKMKSKSLNVESPISGKYSRTLFNVKNFYKNATLVEAVIFTGRKHQIRIHASYIDHPIAGDDKYGDFEWNRKLKKLSLKRIFLHAYKIRFINPISMNLIEVVDPLPKNLQSFLEKI